MKYLRALLLTLIIFVLFHAALAQSDQPPLALVMTADGEIMPAMKDYIHRGIQTAEQRDAEVLIIKLNTPGGDIGSMLDIIQDIRASTVPVVVYVSPSVAGSAGALITMAGQASAMTPEAAIGASSPIDSSGQDLEKTLETKQKEIMKAKIRPLVERRGSQALQLAQDMIDKAKAVTAQEALDAKLIDFIATDTTDLLKKIDGLSVQMSNGPRTLHTSNVRTEELPMSFIEQLLLLITNSNIAFILLSIGVLALQIEISHPGTWAPGFVGIVCLSLAIYGIGILPVNWFGLVFMLLAFVLFILDIKAPTHGALTTAGVASFIVGALVLFNSPGTPQFQRVSVPLVVGTGIFFGLIFFSLLMFVMRAQRGRIQTGVESLLGRIGTARTFKDDAGQVQLEAELWSAERSPDSATISKGDRVEVVEVRGLRLMVKKK